MDDTRLPLVKGIQDFFKSIENSGHDLFGALEIVLDEEYDKSLIDSCCDLKLENIKLEETIRLCHERFEAEKDFVRIGKATEKVFKDGYVLANSNGRYAEYDDISTIEELTKELESEGN